MTQEKAKKRGRPSQLLQMAELHAFVEFLLEKDPRSELQNQVIDALQAEDFNFEMLSEAQQILVKEALKPYREHLKLQLLFDELSQNFQHTEYEEKFMELYQGYKQDGLDPVEMNILKMMCTRYLNFKAQKLEYSDLELYLGQIQKKNASEKRKAENKRKFELGGAVLAAFKKLNLDISKETPEQITNRIVNNKVFHDEVKKSKIFSEVSKYKKEYFERNKLFIDVLEGLHIWKKEGMTLTQIEIEKVLRKNNE